MRCRRSRVLAAGCCRCCQPNQDAFPGCPFGVCLVTARTVEGMARILARLVDRADVLRGDVMPVDRRASQELARSRDRSAHMLIRSDYKAYRD